MVPERWILTFSGHRVDITNPKVEDIIPFDIAHSLSMQCRFTGHTAYFYSVAEHSLRVMKVVEAELKHNEVDARTRTQGALAALLHDASEAYLTDIAAPIKPLLTEYGPLEDRVQAVIYERFGVDPKPFREMIKRADLMLLAAERRDLMPPGGPKWEVLEGVKPIAERISPWPPEGAKDMFMQHLFRLRQYGRLFTAATGT